MAPEFVLRYLVTHEAVHLAVPDHSQKFWLTVRSLCKETERAKQWLSANTQRLTVDLREIIPGWGDTPRARDGEGNGRAKGASAQAVPTTGPRPARAEATTL